MGWKSKCQRRARRRNFSLVTPSSLILSLVRPNAVIAPGTAMVARVFTPIARRIYRTHRLDTWQQPRCVSATTKAPCDRNYALMFCLRQRGQRRIHSPLRQSTMTLFEGTFHRTNPPRAQIWPDLGPRPPLPSSPGSEEIRPRLVMAHQTVDDSDRIKIFDFSPHGRGPFQEPSRPTH